MQTSGAGVGVAVGIGVAVGLGVAVGIGVAVGLGVAVGIGVAVGLGVAVGIGVAVGLGVAVGIGVAVGLGVAVGIGVAVGVAVGIGVAVGVAVGIGVAVGTTKRFRPREIPGISTAVGDGLKSVSSATLVLPDVMFSEDEADDDARGSWVTVWQAAVKREIARHSTTSLALRNRGRALWFKSDILHRQT